MIENHKWLNIGLIESKISFLRNYIYIILKYDQKIDKNQIMSLYMIFIIHFIYRDSHVSYGIFYFHLFN